MLASIGLASVSLGLVVLGRPSNGLTITLATLPAVAALLALCTHFAAIVGARAVAWLYFAVLSLGAFAERSVPLAAGCAASALAIVALDPRAYEQAAERVGFAPLRARPVFLAGITGATGGAIVLALVALGLATSPARSDHAFALALGTGAIGMSAVVLLVTRMRGLGILLAAALSVATAAWAAAVRDPGEGGEVFGVLAVIVVAPAAWLVAATLWARWFPRASAGTRRLPWSWLVGLAGVGMLVRALVA